jgi:O-antigen/teichoic acid export membrane protein
MSIEELEAAPEPAASPSTLSASALLSAGARPEPAATPARPGSLRREPSLRSSAVSMVASQLVLGAVGLATLPVLTRQLGPAAYGEFSLFVTLLGVVTYQDVARQLLIREEVTREAGPAELDGLARLSTAFVVGLALAVGLAVLPLGPALALALAAAFHGFASRDFAALSSAGRVAFANSTRNLAWAGAFAAAAGLAFLGLGAWAFAAPFVLANAAIFASYRFAREPRASAPTDGSWLDALRRSPHRARYRRAALDLLGFTLASSAIASLDRVLLDELVGGEAFGVYCGAADVALRLHIVSSALSAALFPLLARELDERGYEHAARRFLGVVSKATPLYFAALALAILLAAPLLPRLLGPEFAPSTPIFVALAAALFVHSFGFFATPWQRAQGDFASQRRAYTIAACAMATVGLVAIPLWGAWGAVAAYAAARTAELQLVALEVKRIPRALLPRWKLAAAAGMFALLVGLSVWRIAGS